VRPPIWRASIGAVNRVLRGDKSHLNGAAQVWAEATAARDGDPDVAPLEFSRPIIARVFGQPRAVLVIALDDDDQVVAFAVAEPLLADAEPRRPATSAEVQCVGVHPKLWGTGLGRQVIQYLCAELAADGFLNAQLLVYADNSRAVRLYQQLGWRPQGTPAPHPRTGKPEQCYHLTLAG
jgi:ribosomal protein S18 acetylase RimI-like enzyme